MRRKFTLYSLLIAVFAAILFLSMHALTHAQNENGNDVLLPFVAADGAGEQLAVETTLPATPVGSNNPTTIPATDTPTTIQATDTPTAPDNSVWDPPPSPTPTATLEPSYPDFVAGSYNMRLDTREGWGEYRSDGTFSERWSTFGDAGTRTYDGSWFVNDGQLFLAFTDHNGGFHTTHFLIEETTDGLRVMGGDQLLGSVLLERADQVDSIGSYAGETVPISRWMPGRWSYVSGITIYQLILDKDGHYKLYRAPSYADDDELGDPLETGQWSIWADQMILLPDGETQGEAHTYAVTKSTRGFIEIQGGRFGRGDVGLLRKRFFPPSSMWAYEGQYVAGDVVLTIKDDGDEYRADLLDEGVRTVVTGTLNADNHLVLQKGVDDTYDPLSPHFNTLYFDGFEMPHWLPKVSETALPLRPSNFGLWIIDYTSFSDSELWLLPDGRYVSKSGTGFQTRGTYTIADGLITYDPVCDPPYSREIEFVDNQMVQKSSSTVLTYHYVPEKLGDLMASMAASDQREGQLNAAFAATHLLGPRDPNYFTVPAGNVVADFDPSNVYADATVFSEEEAYVITFLTDPPNQIALFFFPNGRYQFYSRTFVDLGGGVGEYRTETSWSKYKIEGEVVYLGDGTGLPLKLGRRRVMWDETCLDHLDWVSDDDLR